MATKQMTWKSNQSIFDLAFIAYGYFDVMKLVSENTFITDITSVNYVGKQINYTPVINDNYKVLGLTNKVPNTGNDINYLTETDLLEQENGYYFELEDNSGRIELEN